MSKQALILTGFGLFNEEPLTFGLTKAGFTVKTMHLNLLGQNHEALAETSFLVIPGGASFGDDNGAGLLLAAKIRQTFGPALEAYVKKGGLVLGIGNGFQVLNHLGYFSAGQKPLFNLLANEPYGFVNQWVSLKLNPAAKTPLLKGIKKIDLPVRCAFGRFVAEEKNLDQIINNGQAALFYDGENPTGAFKEVAALANEDGRVLGMMPHPEDALFFHNHPHWALKRDQLERAGKPVPEDGPGLAIFINAFKAAK